jgi:hypothetical protein
MSETERTENLETARLVATAVVDPNFQKSLLMSTNMDRVRALRYQGEKFTLTYQEAAHVANAVLSAHIEGNPTLSQVAKNLAEYQETDRL